jgi:hypothetical protein
MPDSALLIEPLSLNLKGQRDYLQGGDLCQAVMEFAGCRLDGRVDRLLLGVHRFMHRQPDLHWHDGAKSGARPEKAAADFSVSSQGAAFSGWLVETDRQVTNRIPFDEERITRLCTIRGQAIDISGNSGYLPIEVAVSMTKKLHNLLLPTNDGRWIFAKIDLNRLLREDDASALSVVLMENLYNRLTKSEIHVAGTSVGYMYFSLLRS